MFADDFVFRVFVMIKAQVVFPGFQAVTGVAIFFGKVALKEVDIIFFVATHAACRLAEIADRSGANGFRSEFLFMAFCAFNLGVFSFESISGEFAMVEFILVHGHCVKVAAFVLAVTLHTVFVGEAVEATFLCDEGADGLMAIQTFFIRDPFAGVMALETVFIFKILMAFNQRAGCQQFTQDSFLLSPRETLEKENQDNEEERRLPQFQMAPPSGALLR